MPWRKTKQKGTGSAQGGGEVTDAPTDQSQFRQTAAHLGAFAFLPQPFCDVLVHPDYFSNVTIFESSQTPGKQKSCLIFSPISSQLAERLLK